MGFLTASANASSKDSHASSTTARPLTLQAKLRMGQPDDAYEQEADRVADSVVRKSSVETVHRQPDDEEQLQPKSGNVITPLIQSQAEEEGPVLANTIQPQAEEEEEAVQAKVIQPQAEEEEESVQAKVIQPQAEEEEESVQTKSIMKKSEGDLDTESDIESTLISTKGGGSPMSTEMQQFMGSRFGTDFSAVRIHTDGTAAQMSKQINAQAFTHGKDIYFNEGKYHPDSASGKHLLAHELTHTIQQGAVAPKRSTQVIQATEPKIQRLSISSILNKVAGYIPGFHLITVMIGRNPITGKSVPRSGVNILKGVLSLIPVFGNLWFGNLKKTGAADKAGTWLDGQLKILNISWFYIKGLFSEFKRRAYTWRFWKNIGLAKEIFSPPWQRIKRFAGAIGTKIKEFILDGALALAGAAGKQVKGILNKGKTIFTKILNDPLQFVKNFLKAVGTGFSNFGKNFIKHLKGALFGWMFGAFSGAGIELPKSFDIKSIFGFILQIFGLTYTNIRAKLVKKLGPKGERVISVIEKSVSFVKDLITKGPTALWEKVKESLSNLKQIIFDKVRDWLMQTLVVKALTKLAMMFNPVGALIQAAMAIYNTVMFFIERWNQLKELVNGIFGAIGPIAFGKLKKASGFVEQVLSKGLTLAISFLARFVGLGGIVDKIRGIIAKLRKPVDNALDKVIGWLVKKGKAMFGKGKEKLGALFKWWKMKNIVSAAGKKIEISFDTAGKKVSLMIKASPKRGFMNYLKVLKGVDKESTLYKDTVALGEKLDKTQMPSKKNDISKGEADKIRKSANKFASLIKKLNEMAGGDKPMSVIKFGGLDSEQGATLMTAEILSPKHPKGSPVRDMPPIMKDLADLGQRGGRAPHYIQGHLLNNHLGGPGKRWNLTPITKSANSQHSRSFEEPLKTAVNKNQSVVKYTVKVISGAHSHRKGFDKLDNIINNLVYLEKAKEVNFGLPNWLRREHGIMSAEKNLSGGFNISAEKLEKNDAGAWTKVGNVAGINGNEVKNETGGDQGLSVGQFNGKNIDDIHKEVSK